MQEKVGVVALGYENGLPETIASNPKICQYIDMPLAHSENYGADNGEISKERFTHAYEYDLSGEGIA